MLSTLAAIAILGLQGQYSIYRELVPKPTGKNGYEEYLMACDILRATQAQFLVSEDQSGMRQIIELYESPSPPMRPPKAQYEAAKRLLGANILQVRREAVAQATKVLDLIIQGNKKPVYDPRESVRWSSFSELKEFRTMGRLFQAAAYVALADGQPARAAQFIIESLRFGQKLSGLRLNARYSAIVIQSFAFESIEKYLPSLGLKDLSLVEAAAAEILGQKPAIFRIIENDLSDVKEHYRDLLVSSMGKKPADDDSQTVKFIRKLTLADIEVVLERCAQNVARRKQVLIAHFEKPEAAWSPPIDIESAGADMENIKSIDSLVDVISESFRPGFATAGKHEAVNRTQLRLIKLVSAVARFRWENDRLPASLSELSRDLADPISGGQFQYELIGNGFRVYSRGAKETGEIGLRYQSPGSQDTPPPTYR